MKAPALGELSCTPSNPPRSHIQERHTKSNPKVCEVSSCCYIAQDSVQRLRPMFSEPRDDAQLIERLFDLLNVDTRLRRPTCLVFRDTPSTGPASPLPLLDLSSTVSTLDLRCEGLVATVRCARGTLQVRELCIKAVRKAKRG